VQITEFVLTTFGAQATEGYSIASTLHLQLPNPQHNLGLGCRPKLEVADFFDAVPTPELITLQGILRVGVNHNCSAVPASKKEHPFHLMELHFLLVFLPDRVAIFADGIANLAEKEIANHG
jgi:hypothetical protein